MKKKLLIIVPIIIFVILGVSYLPIKLSVKSKYIGTYGTLESPDLNGTLTLQVKGTYERNLLRDDVFTGQITIDEFDTSYDVSMNFAKEPYEAFVYYMEYGKPKQFGRMVTTKLFDEFIIYVYEDEQWDPSIDSLIVFPADTAAKAKDLISVISSN